MIDEGRIRRLEATRPPGTVASSAITVPNVVEFAISPDYLNQKLYPRQATLLKTMFCAPQLWTDYDRGVLAEWTAGFTVADHNDGTAGYQGTCGMVADVVERIQFCRAQGRGWFREIVMVAGRRASKGFLGAVSTAYVLWHQLALLDPRHHYGIARGKQVHVLVFAGQHEQALTNQFRDLADVIRSAPCFQPFIAKTSRDGLWLYSSAQLSAGGVDPGDAMFVITAKEATPGAGRGPAAIVELFDEMAHTVAAGSNRSAEEIFSAATPALAQFPSESFLYEASSPWQQQGQFYANYRRGLAVDPETRHSLDPDMLVVQLASHELYRDWRLTHTDSVPAWPGGPALAPCEKAIFDATAGNRLRRSDPHHFDVEYGARWATSVSAYLPAEDVDVMFASWDGRSLRNQREGSLGIRYVAHADPSVSGANFAVVVAHREEDDERRGHVIVDYIHVWRPGNFPDGRIDYEVVAEALARLMDRFRLAAFSFDQFQSAGLMAKLKAQARDSQHHRQTAISERTATSRTNQQMCETLKTALARRLVHAPHNDLLEDELRNLEIRNGRVDHPTRGPVQTSDLVDCVMNVVEVLIGDNNGDQFGKSFGDVAVRGSRPAHPFDEAFSATHRTTPQGISRGHRPSASRGGRMGHGRQP